MGALPFGLLVLALLVLLLSTNQFALWIRAVVWTVGAACLAISGVILSDAGLEARAVGVLLTTLREGPASLVLSANWVTVSQALLPLSAVLFATAVLLAILALVAFTPGERIEQLARRLIVLLIGFFAGGAFALLSVALGFAGYVKPRAYIFWGDSAEIIDGDTLRIGDVSLRLDDVDALEHEQTCLTGALRTNCGAESAQHLRELVNGAVVICTRRNNPTILPREAFSRPIVTCETAPGSDIGEAMIRSGLAVRYVRPNRASQFTPVGERCALHPSTWRRGGNLRESFEEAGATSALCN